MSIAIGTGPSGSGYGQKTGTVVRPSANQPGLSDLSVRRNRNAHDRADQSTPEPNLHLQAPRLYPTICLTTFPCTSVNRKYRP
jgi:hypothetical protein